MGHPEHRAGKTEQKVQRLGDGRHRCAEGQRQQGRRRGAPRPGLGAEDEGRRNAPVAKGLGKAGVHPHHAVGKRQSQAILGHHDAVSAGIGVGPHRQHAPQRRKLEGYIHQVMQPQRDQQPFQKAIQEHPGLAGGGDPPGKCADGPLHRRPKIAGPCAKQHRSGSLPQKGPPHPGVQLPCRTGEPA